MKLKVVQTFGALGLIAGATLLTFSVSPASAEDDSRQRNAENTFTKWVLNSIPVPPVLADMAGVVGGDVGVARLPGRFLP